MKYLYYMREPAFRVGNIDVQSVQRPKNYRHSFCVGREKNGFIYICSGKMIDTFRGGRVESLCAAEGELIFIPRGSVYTGVYAEENTKIKIIQFDLLSGELPPYLSAPTKIDILHAKELVEKFFPTGEASVAHPFYFLSCLYELLWQIDEMGALPHKNKKLKPALVALTEQAQENEKISHYAALCGMSEAGFRRLFRAYTGQSPVEYRNSVRLSWARSKLQSGEYTVSEAAYECGFSNLSFFIRLYKKKYGITPKKE